jgi:hypothetical protein
MFYFELWLFFIDNQIFVSFVHSNFLLENMGMIESKQQQ